MQEIKVYKKKVPSLSLCIPTYNRERFLRRCLNSILTQCKDSYIYNQVEIIISNNNSTDNTEETIKRYQKTYRNIKYFKNKTNIGADRNVIKVASYAQGDYIWFFSDDDLHYIGSLKTMLSVILRNEPDAVVCNLNLCSKDGTKILSRNLLNIQQDCFVKTKKELFTLLETKFMWPVDWYTTCISNIVISKVLFDTNVNHVMKFYSRVRNNFLHTGIIYYKSNDYSIYVISKPLVKFRADNRSFGPDERDQVNYLSYIQATFSAHNKTLYKFNKQSMSLKFRFLLFLKNFTRQLRIVCLRYFHADIANIALRIMR